MALIELVVQWRVTCNLNTLWQCFGHAVRDLLRDGVAILLAEAKYFDEMKEKAVEHAEKAREARKRKAAASLVNPCASKAARMEDQNAVVPPGRAADELEQPDTPPSPSVQHMEETSQSDNGRDTPRSLEFKEEQRPKQVQNKRCPAEDAILPEMDAFINAGTRPHKCFRAPFTAFYGNDQTGMLCPYLWLWVHTIHVV